MLLLLLLLLLLQNLANVALMAKVRTLDLSPGPLLAANWLTTRCNRFIEKAIELFIMATMMSDVGENFPSRVRELLLLLAEDTSFLPTKLCLIFPSFYEG